MMNDLAEAMREAAEILHEIGGYSALVDDLRYGADEVESAEPVAYEYWWPESPRHKHLAYASDMPTNHQAILKPLFYRHPPSAVPEGWQLVPLEPTHQMLLASYRPEIPFLFRREMYKAMLAAAPGAGGE